MFKNPLTYNQLRYLGIISDLATASYYKIAKQFVADSSYLKTSAANILTQYSLNEPNSPLINAGWKVIDAFRSSHGLEILVYENANTKDVVFFAPGSQTTDEPVNAPQWAKDLDVATTASIYNDHTPDSVFEFVGYFKEFLSKPGSAAYANYSYTFSGHSLGGSVARMAATVLNLEGINVDAVLFNSFGTSQLLNNLGLNSLVDNFSSTDIVNITNSMDGRTLEWNGFNFGTTLYSLPEVYDPINPWGITNHKPENINTQLLSLSLQYPVDLPSALKTTFKKLVASAIIRNSAELITDATSLIIGKNTVKKGDGNDILVGKDFNSGNTIAPQPGTQYNDSLSGGAGNDILFGDKGNDTLDGGTGNDTYYGSLGDDTFIYKLYATAPSGKPASKLLGGFLSADAPGAGSKGSAGHDVIINAFGDNDTLILDESFKSFKEPVKQGNDLVLSFSLSNSITVKDYYNGKAVEHIEWSDGTKLMLGTEGTDRLDREYGDEVQLTFGGNDTLLASSGNDYLYGGKGYDSYFYTPGAGTDVIYDEDGIGKLFFSEDFNLFNTSPERVGNDLVFTFSDSLPPRVYRSHTSASQTLTIKDYYAGHKIDYYLPEPDFKGEGLYDLLATFENIDLVWYGGSDYSFGFSFYAEVDTDFDGVVDDDAYYETWADLPIPNHDLWEPVYKYPGKNVLFLPGDVVPEAETFLVIPLTKGTLDDEIRIIQANDVLMGGGTGALGNDTYVYFKGMRNKTYIEESVPYSSGVQTWLDRSYRFYYGGEDTLYLAGVNSTDVTFSQSFFEDGIWLGGDDYADTWNLVIEVNNGETIDIVGFFDGVYRGNYLIEKFKFADVELSWRDIYHAVGSGASSIVGVSSDPELLIGNSTDQSISGGAGIDHIFGASFNDTLDGGDGDDVIDAGTGNDTLIGGYGNDRFIIDSENVVVTEYADQGDDTIQTSLSYSLEGLDYVENLELSGNADITATGNDFDNKITGNWGSNILTGGEGDDTLYGGWGSDTYIFNLGDGSDVIEQSADQADDLSTDTLKFGSGITFEDLIFTWDSDDLVIQIDGTSDEIRIQNQRLPLVEFASYQQYQGIGIEKIQMDDGSEYSLSELFANLATTGTDSDDYLYTAEVPAHLIGYAGNDDLYGDLGDDTLDGGSGDDYLYGGVGNDYLDGGEDDDYLIGGLGDDIFRMGIDQGDDTISDADYDYYLGSGDDTILFDSGIDDTDVQFGASGTDLNITFTGEDGSLTVENFFDPIQRSYHIENFQFDNTTLSYEDVLSTLSNTVSTTSDDLLIGDSIGQSISGDAGNDTIYGLGGDDTLNAGDGDDYLVGGMGNDEMFGGLGNDTYLVNSDDDTVSEDPGEGTDDHVYSTVTYTLGNDVEHLTLVGTGNINATGNSLANRIEGNEGDNILQGGTGDGDSLYGSAGNDTYQFSAGDGNDFISEGFYGYSAEPIDGIDTLEFTDIALSEVSFSIDEDDLVIQRVGTSDKITIQNHFDYLNNPDYTYGRVETFEFYGGDTKTWQEIEGLLEVRGTEYAESLYGSEYFAETINGLAGDDYLYADGGDDTLDGGEGDDELSGSYNASDTFKFGNNWGRDTIYDSSNDDEENSLDFSGVTSSAIFVDLGATENQVTDDTNTVTWDEYARITQVMGGDGNDTIIGSDADNNIVGGDGNDYLDGGIGADTLIGGLGNDTFVVDDENDVLIEAVSEGVDTVEASISYTLGENNLEILVLTGHEDISGTGSSGDNQITGNDGNNTLDGGAGNDTMAGGLGDDTYIITAGDSIFEKAYEGIDTVETDFSYTLLDDFENLTLTGSSNITGTGNALDNVIIGNSGDNTLTGDAGNDILDGGEGADSLVGGIGDDYYIVDDLGDTVTEGSDAGIDTVESSVTFALDSNTENLILTGDEAIEGTGNALDNIMIGNEGANSISSGDGNDILDGGAGNDTLIGGDGDDVYFVDETDDVVTEAPDKGDDTVYSSATYTLGANIENLTLFGLDNIDATGNTLDNEITGSLGDNVLDGGAGNDTLSGGYGNDTYVIDVNDTISENEDEGIDTVEADFTYALGDNLENLTLTGSSNIDGTGNELGNTIIGNTGNNVLTGEDGDDTYIFADGWGNDTLAENVGEGTDTLDFSAVTNSYNLTIDLSSQTASDTIGGNYANWTSAGDYIENAIGGGGDDTITGNANANVLAGGVGNDGDDALSGGDGNDTYVFADGWGNDQITEGTGVDTVDLSAVTGDLTIDLDSAGDEVTDGLGNVIGWSGTVIENVYAGSGNDVITGNSAANRLGAGTGDDTLDGEDGNDTYAFGPDWGVDVISDSSGIDTVDMTGALNDLMIDLSAAGTNVTDGFNIVDWTGTVIENAIGGEGYDSITGTSGDNYLDGGAGIDTLIGGDGNDTYGVDDADDLIIENTAEGTDTVEASVSYALEDNDNLENLTLVGTDDIAGLGDAGDNVVTGNSGNNLLAGRGGDDNLSGGSGNDTYYFEDAWGNDTLTENVGEGTDTLDFSAVTSGYDLTIDLSSQSVSDTIGGNYANWVSAGDYIENAIGGGGDDTITGNANANILAGGAGNDGNDALSGGDGDDTYLFADGWGNDQITEGIGTDTVDMSAVTEDLTIDLDSAGDEITDGLGNVVGWSGTVIENAVGGIGNDDITGNAGANTLEGYYGDDSIDGEAATDVLFGGYGNDTLIGGTGDDSLDGGADNDTYKFSGTWGADEITGDEAGVDTIDLSAVSVALTVELESVGVKVTDGTNTVDWDNATIDIENVIGGSAADNITGNSNANQITGGGADDTLDGGDGDDTYLYADTWGEDQISDSDGSDTVDLSAVAVSLTIDLDSTGTEVSDGTNTIDWTGTIIDNAIGGSAADTITGNANANVLAGGAGNDGNDALSGEDGDDTYLFADGWGNDTITEGSTGGSDRVDFSAVSDSYGLTIDLSSQSVSDTVGGNYANWVSAGDYIEDAVGGAGNDTITGNTAANILDGYDGDDSIDGEAGADTIYGGFGNDTLIGGVGNDELDGGYDNDTYVFSGTWGADIITGDYYGVDTIDLSAVSADLTIDLASSGIEVTDQTNTVDWEGLLIENVLAGSGNDEITGSNDDNYLVGSAGNDTIYGELGNDTYGYDDSWGTDQIVDADGIDTVDLSDVATALTIDLDTTGNEVTDGTNTINWSGKAVENVIGGSANDAITGSSDDNYLAGSGGDDTIIANAGDDILEGGSGADSLEGGDGNDIYVFSEGWGNDTVSNDTDGLNIFDFSTLEDDLTINLSTGAINDGGASNLVNLSGGTVIYGVIGGSGNDTIVANSIAGIVYGMDGDDDITGTGYNDTIIAGDGNDDFDGGDGDDLYVFENDWGHDSLTSENSGIDTLDFSAVTAGLTIDLDSAGTEVSDGTNTVDWGQSATFIENIITGSGNDSITGSSSVNVIYSGDGNDTISSEDGNDQLYSGAGNDNLSAGTGEDTLDGGEGDDSLDGGADNDMYMFADSWGSDTIADSAGTDTLDFENVYSSLSVDLSQGTVSSGNDFVHFSGVSIENVAAGYGDDLIIGSSAANSLQGKEGHDILVGGSGDDLLDGGSGDDIYEFSDGWGIDTILDTEGVDTLDLSTVSGNLTVDLEADDFYTDNAEVSDGTSTISWDAIYSNIKIENIVSGIGDDDITANAADNLIYGNDGDDLITAGAGNDILIGGADDDTLSGGVGDDLYIFEDDWGVDEIDDESDGFDTLDFSRVTTNLSIDLFSAGTEVTSGSNSVNWSNTLFEQVIGGSGQDSITGNSLANIILGGAGDDTLIGNAGNDVLLGDEGNDSLDAGSDDDVYQFNGGWGQDTISGDADGDDSVDLSLISTDLVIDLESAGINISDGSNTVEWSGTIIENVTSGQGNDSITGSSGDNIIEAGAGNDILDSGGGNDTFRFSQSWGQDVISAASGTNDTIDLSGTVLDVTVNLTSSASAEVVEGENSIEWNDDVIENVYSGFGNDDITGSSGNNSIKGQYGDDTLSGAAGEDTIEGGDGDDSLDGGSGNDTLIGGRGDDTLEGGLNDDTFLFSGSWGHDQLSDSGGIDTVDLSILRRSLVVDLDTSEENIDDGINSVNWSGAIIENVITGDGDDSIIASAADNEIDAGDGNNTVDGEAGNDEITTGSGNDSITGGSDNDNMTGGIGNDTYSFANGWGNDTLVENDGEGIDVIDFSLVESGNHLDINLESDFASYGSNLVSWSGDYIENAFGGSGNDTITGNAYNNELRGGEGNDSLDGGDADDVLDGGEGNDIYFFNSVDDANWGNDLITDSNGSDTVKIQLTNASRSFTINLNSDENQDEIYDDVGNSVNWSSNIIENVITYPGNGQYTIIGNDDANRIEVWNQATITAGDGNDVIISYAGNNIITGGDGDDYIEGGVGNDALYGGSGSDTIYGEDPSESSDNNPYDNDTIDGGDGDDTLEGGYGNNTFVFTGNWGNDFVSHVNVGLGTVDFSNATAGVTVNLTSTTGDEATDGTNTVNWLDHEIDAVIGSDYNDTLTGYVSENILDAGAGDDVITGGSGSDTLIGGTGDDLYIFADGWGNDTLSENDAGGTDTLDFSSVTSGNHLTIDLDSNSASYSTNYVNWTSDYVENAIGGSGNDTITGTDGANKITGGEGDDNLSAGAGNDTYFYTDDWDVDGITDTAGVDTLDLSAVTAALTISMNSTGGDEVTDGTNTINWGSTEIENLISGSGNDDINGTDANNIIWGGVGNDTGDDTIDGFGGADLIYGGDGNDTVRGDDGDDTVYGDAGDDNVVGGNGSDYLYGGLGNDSLRGNDGGDYYIFEAGWGNDTITDELSSGSGNDVIDFSAVTNNLTIKLTAGAGSEVDDGAGNYVQFTSSGYIEHVISGSGNDTIYGSSASGNLNNSLDGGAGNDTYKFANAWGTDTIVDASGTDTLDLSGVVSAAVTVNLSSSGGSEASYSTNTINWDNDAIENVIGTNVGDTITGSSVANVIDGGAGQDNLTGGDGNDTLLGGADNDTLDGGNGDDLLDGSSGSDSISGGAGEDTLVAGTGADTLDGGADNDTYVFVNAWGTDTISADSSGTDTLDFSAVTSAMSIRFDLNSAYYSAHTLDWTGVTLENALGGSGSDNIVGSGSANTLYGNAGNDTINGVSGTDLLYGGDGNDSIRGGDDGDTLYGDAGLDILEGENGNDVLYGGAGNDTLNGGAGSDTMYGGEGNDYFYSVGGADTMYGGDGNDVFVIDDPGDVVIEYAAEGAADIIQSSIDCDLGDFDYVERLILTGSNDIDGTGNELDNVLWGQSGNNVLSGGGGNDTLDGFAGDDMLQGGAGNDSYTGFNGTSGDDTINDSAGTADVANFGSLTLGNVVSWHGVDTGDDMDSNIDQLVITFDSSNVIYIDNYFDNNETSEANLTSSSKGIGEIESLKFNSGGNNLDFDDVLYLVQNP